MYALLGAPTLSLSYIKDLISYTDYSCFVFDSEICSYNTDIILVSRTEDLFRYRRQFNLFKGIVIVFDYPDKIIQFKGITYLESPYDYNHSILSAETLAVIIKQHMQPSKYRIKPRPYNLIKTVITRETERNIILFTYTKLVYSIPKIRRDEIKRIIINFFFSMITLNTFMEQLQKFVKDRNRSYYDNLITYINTSPQFQRLQLVLKEIKKARFSKIIDYKALSLKHNVDSYQIIYLTKLYQELNP